VGERRAGATRTARLAMVAAMLAAIIRPLAAQELEPAAYRNAPVGLNFVSILTTISRGDIAFDPAGPITNASSTISATALSFGRTLAIGRRSANVGLAMPYVIGNVKGTVLGIADNARRSGQGDLRIRVAMNLYGAPAMSMPEFASYRQQTIVGVSLAMVAPLGQYASRKLINIGTNRWAFKPEVGLSRARGRWTIETYGGVWLFSTNDDLFGHHVRAQRPITLLQFHVEYTVRRGMWVAGNANFYAGGRTVIDGVANADLQRNSRVGATWLFPAGRGRAVRLAVSRGAYTTIGADFTSLSAVYQYVWGGRPQSTKAAR
jgi:hypothetical protein